MQLHTACNLKAVRGQPLSRGVPLLRQRLMACQASMCGLYAIGLRIGFLSPTQGGP